MNPTSAFAPIPGCPATARAGVLSVILCLLASVSSADVCCPPQRVHDAAWPCMDRVECRPWCLASDGQGGVYIVAEMAFNEHYLLVSRDEGAGWEIRPLPQGPRRSVPGCAAGPSGDLVVVYNGADELLYAEASHDQGRSFGPPVQIDGQSPDPVGDRKISMGPTGITAVVWDGGLHHDMVWGAVSPDGGRTWRPGQPIRHTSDDDIAEDGSPAVVASQTTVIASWAEGGEIWAARTADGGRTWDRAQRIAPVPGSQIPELIDMSTTLDQGFQVAYEAADGMWVKVSLDDGLTWPEEPFLLPDGYCSSCVYGDLHALPCGAVLLAADVQGSMVVACSLHHGLPGTWIDPVTFPDPGGADYMTLASDPTRRVWLSESDLRDVNPQCPDCSSVYLTRSCDEGRSYLFPHTRVDLDVPPFPLPSYDPYLSVSPLGRAHVVWVDSAWDDPSGTSHIRYAAFDAEPMIRPGDLRCATSCARGVYYLEAVGGGQGSCLFPTYRWYVDGNAVAGATESVFRVPGDLPPGAYQVHYEVACWGSLPCGGESARFQVDVLDEPWDSIDSEIEEPIRVAREDEEIRLSWTDLEWRSRGYNIYAGSIDDLHWNAAYDHAALVCGVPRTDLAQVDFTRLVPLPDSNTYYLIGAAGCWDEGSLGASSAGVGRPVPGAGQACGGLP